jgi:hypothetical protein
VAFHERLASESGRFANSCDLPDTGRAELSKAIVSISASYARSIPIDDSGRQCPSSGKVEFARRKIARLE